MTIDNMTPAAGSGKPIPSAPQAERHEITDYAGVPGTKISQARDRVVGTFDEIVNWIGPVTETTRDKHSVDAWAPHVTPGPRTARTHVTLFVIDCDKLGATEISALGDRLDADSIAFYLHTTYGHTTEQPKVRIVCPLSRPVPAELWKVAWPALMRAVGLDPVAAVRADRQCRDASRIYFRPTCPPERLAFARAHHGRGDRSIDVDAVLANERVTDTSALGSTIADALQGLNEVKVSTLRSIEDCLVSIKTAPEKHGSVRDGALRMGSIFYEDGVTKDAAEEIVWLACKTALEENARLGSSEPVRDWANVENLARSGVRLAYETTDPTP
jgi:hypothetical protein